ncbi:hypothetical protein ASG40_04160 [Methylobacterium sp. Leaf399]|uniref:head-tail connector protein n=1 Tax=unclassified Methylobacterium TaxID=2615210 RepID=UPI0006F25C0C|nr:MULTISPECIES: phage head-tail connector protein [unclassified Methylobacterium]KQT19997.1 hypothetical protein ASG40_04160 [Methylobacterium sp. Leaf399]KQT78514.1 hypothetical protein ASG59_08590 [Methylobacterium sp. Leaf466]
MTPIRLDEDIVEPVSLAEMRLHLRLDPDDGGAEDGLVAALIAAARASVEAETRRVLAPGRYRVMLTAWPPDGRVPLPLSPLVALARAGTVDGDGTVTPLAPGLVRLGDDPVEAPGLVVSAAVPELSRRVALIEVEAGHGGAGPPVPAPLTQAIRLLVAHGFERRGDEAGQEPRPPAVAALIAPWRRLRL